MKIVVLGSTGMAGHVIAQYLEGRGHEIYRTSRSELPSARSAAIDVTDFSAMGTWLEQTAPDVIVNCVGLLQKACDARPDLAVLINSYLPHWLEQRYAATAVRVIHLSTDCVFSGLRGGYRETDTTDGATLYDRSKAMGEVVNEKDLTFRMSIIGPDIDPRGTGLLNWFLTQRGTVQGYRLAIWNGVTTIELAHAIDAAIHCGLSGLYQLVPNASIDKCSLLELIGATFHKTDVTILPTDGGVHLDKSLVNSRTDFPYKVPAYAEQIADMKQWIDSHAELYPHYGR